MKWIIPSYIFVFFTFNTMMFCMEFNSIQNIKDTDMPRDYVTGKAAIAITRQYSALGAVTSGFTFFAATASRHMHWPYWVKRAPLFGFISFNALNQIPVITGIEQDFKKTSSLGSMINALKNA